MAMYPIRALSLGFALAAIPGALLAQTQDQLQSSCNSTNIRWVLPGEFDRALERAKTERRLLLIKGISFGVDAAGSKCATKGKW